MHKEKGVAALTVTALGVVYGDIGTSPLYAIRESLNGLPVTPYNVLGVLSLILWSLIIVISIKYLTLILRADNDGEGGVLALLALLKQKQTKWYPWFFYIGIFGAGLLLGDAMLTPAISVLSAIEGLKIITPEFDDFVIPVTIIILVTLFFFQYRGTGRIGQFFGPIILLWFAVIGFIGATHIYENPAVLRAINPYYAYEFFHHHGWTAYALLGGVFLVVTGGEALYGDLGHFGRSPIRYGWFMVVLPGLVLNYYGQGAFLIHHPEAIHNPFYSLSPSWFFLPLLVLATLATILASQAVISAAFSLTKQAVLLDLYPRLPIIQTSAEQRGQIYVPQINAVLAIGTILLILAFRSSSGLAHAYGIAVNLDMLVVTTMVTCLAYIHWQWSLIKVIGIFSIFLFVDAAFLGANVQKIKSGGWVPLVFAAICIIIMVTWQKGIEYLRKSFYKDKIDIRHVLTELSHPDLMHLPNSTAIFIADPYDQSGGCLLHYLKLNRIIPEHILILTIHIHNHPYILGKDAFEIKTLKRNIHRLILHYGFMDEINVPLALEDAKELRVLPANFDVAGAMYLVEIPSVSATRKQKTLMFFWQEKLFAFLMRNAVMDIEFFQLPYNRTIAIGAYCAI